MNNSKKRLLLTFDLVFDVDDDDELSNAEVEEGESRSSFTGS
jgi:hypothetical protein